MNKPDDVFARALELWISIAAEAVERQGFFSAAISGGRTPVPLYEKLTVIQDFPWNKTHIFMVDERFVPYNDDANNFRMINQTLLMKLRVPAANVHPIITSALLPEASAEKYEKDLRAFFKSRLRGEPVFDLILLGMGRDGHTASLFPGSPALRETEKYVTDVCGSGNKDAERITITLPVINAAENIIFLITGTEKADTVRDVIEGRSPSLPASMVRPGAGRVYYLLDKEAAGMLKG